MTDAVARNILETLFHTWMLPAVRVSFYDANELKAGALALLLLPSLPPSPSSQGLGGGEERLELPGTVPSHLPKLKSLTPPGAHTCLLFLVSH